MRFKLEKSCTIDRPTVPLLIALFLATSCATPEKGTAIGAGAGAAGGAMIGAVAGGKKGAAIGAATGAAVGGAIGNYLDRQAQELAQVASTQRTTDGIIVNLKNDLLFKTGSAILKPQATTQLNQLGDILVKYPKDRIKVEGYTDSMGLESLNEDLSVRRAKAVQNILLARGVLPSQMIVIGFGEARPLASNSTTAGRSKNRRVELRIDVPQT